MKSSDYKSLKDEELVSLVVTEQKKELFEILYNRYYPKVLDKSYSLLKNKELAQDATQNIFAKTFEKINSFKGISSFSSWLYSITYNYCIDYLRSRKKLHYPEWNRNNEIPEIIDETDEDLTDISYERLMKVMDMVHPEERALIVMKYNDNLSMKQIGTALRISENATKMRLKRAKARLVFLYKKIYSDQD